MLYFVCIGDELCVFLIININRAGCLSEEKKSDIV